MEEIILLTYVISLISAMTALWVWYTNSDSRDQINLLKTQNQQLKEKLENLEKFSKLNASMQAFSANKKR